MTPTLLSVALLLLLPVVPATEGETPFTILVTDSVTDIPMETYKTSGADGGILLGGMRRLRDSNTGFNFTYREHADYGPFLESVNSLAGNGSENTYWQLLLKKSNETIPLDVGIGCYTPSANDTIILNYNKW